MDLLICLVVFIIICSFLSAFEFGLWYMRPILRIVAFLFVLYFKVTDSVFSRQQQKTSNRWQGDLTVYEEDKENTNEN